MADNDDTMKGNKRPVEDNPIVFSTSIALNSKEDSVNGTSLGGYTCEMYPVLSCLHLGCGFLKQIKLAQNAK